MAATNPGDGSRAHRPYLESRRTTFVSRPSSQGLKPVSRLRGTAPEFESSLIARGHSGGALLNGERELLGMLVSDGPPNGRAISMTRVITRLQEWGYPVYLHHPHAQISAGHQRTCRVTYDGAAQCWGETESEPPDFTAETQL